MGAMTSLKKAGYAEEAFVEWHQYGYRLRIIVMLLGLCNVKSAKKIQQRRHNVFQESCSVP